MASISIQIVIPQNNLTTFLTLKIEFVNEITNVTLCVQF